MASSSTGVEPSAAPEDTVSVGDRRTRRRLEQDEGRSQFKIQWLHRGMILRRQGRERFQVDLCQCIAGAPLEEWMKTGRVTLRVDMPGFGYSKGSMFFITQVDCELCRRKVGFEDFTHSSQVRCQRRIDRVIHSEDFSLLAGSGIVVCRACHGSELPYMRLWLREMSVCRVLDVTVSYSVLVQDRGRNVASAVTSYAIGSRRTEDVEQEIMAAVWGRARDHVFDHCDSESDQEVVMVTG